MSDLMIRLIGVAVLVVGVAVIVAAVWWTPTGDDR